MLETIDDCAGGDDDREPDLDLGVEVASLSVRVKWVRWAAVTRFGRHHVPGYPDLALMPPPVDPDGARRLYEMVSGSPDRHRSGVDNVSDSPSAGLRRSSVAHKVEKGK